MNTKYLLFAALLVLAACDSKVEVAVDRDTTVPVDTTVFDGTDTTARPIDTVIARDTVILPPRDTSRSPAPPTDSRNIRVLVPRPGGEITSMRFALAGSSRTFENAASYRLLDASGGVLAEGHFTAAGPMGEFSRFETTVSMRRPYNGPARLEVFQFSAKDGSEIDKVIVPLTIRIGATPGSEQRRIEVFYPNSIRNPGAIDCRLVYSVGRTAESRAVAEAALRALVTGPTPAERGQGFTTSIPPGTRLNSISITGGRAVADFSAELDRAAGSCAVTSARAQIERTLRQFPTVRSVVVSVNGRREEVLQP